MIDDLATWLREQIAERRRTVELSGPARVGWATYRHEDGSMAYTSPVAELGDGSGWVTAGQETDPQSVVVVFDPAAELALCDAHTAILDLYERAALRPESQAVAHNNTVDRGYREALEDAVKCVGLAYQHNDGYDERWRP